MTFHQFGAPADRAPNAARSVALYHFDADDCGVELGGFRLVSGQLATVTRGATATATDALGVSHDVMHAEPALDYLTVADAMALDAINPGAVPWTGWRMGTSDRCVTLWRARPAAMTVLLEFVETGAVGTADSPRFSLSTDTLGSNPRWQIKSTGTAYQVEYHNGTTAVASTAAATPATGNLVRLIAKWFTNGSVQLAQSIGGAAFVEAAASSALARPAAWTANTYARLNAIGTATGGAAVIRTAKLLAGTNSSVALVRGLR